MTARNSDVMGVTVTRAALITNTKAIAQTTGYEYEKSIVSLVDPKREVGLATAVLAVSLYSYAIVFIVYCCVYLKLLYLSYTTVFILNYCIYRIHKLLCLPFILVSFEQSSSSYHRPSVYTLLCYHFIGNVCNNISLTHIYIKYNSLYMQ